MEPAEAINSFEVSIRRLIRAEWGSDWLAKSGFDEEKLLTNLRREVENRRGAIVSRDLLDYTEFSQLATLLRDRWSVFAPVFQSQKYITTYLGRLIHLRNGPMHSRELLPFERDQLSGMVGEIINLIALHRSTKGPDMQHYPVIDSLVDSFGNSALGDSYVTGMRIRVGQHIRIAAKATDPQGREILWKVHVMAGSRARAIQDAARGADTTIDVEILEEDVTESLRIFIYMRSSGKYHRDGEHDAAAVLYYSVDPPTEG